MKHNYKRQFAFFMVMAMLMQLSLNNANATTFERVMSIIESADCQNAACHSGATPAASLDLAGDYEDVYNRLVNVDPVNEGALEREDKLVMPGRPYRSFFLRKVHNGLLHDMDGGSLAPNEGQPMPAYGGSGAPLTKPEAEIIRQWIYAGATYDGDDVNETLIAEYYATGGLDRLKRPQPPQEGRGFQIHLGPFFIDGLEEKEWLLKYDLNLSGDTEVTRMQTFMNESSHHFIVYNISGNPAGVDDGLREVSLTGDLGFFGNNDLVAAWQYPDDYRLPGGTAYFWDESTVLDLNYHLPNYSDTQILPGEVYINVHTQAEGIAEKEMVSDLLIYSTNIFFLLPPGQVTTLSEAKNNSQRWNIWQLTSHTHKLGVDYDIWVRDNSAPEQKGEQIFEGFFDYQYCNCNVGYYDWSHPPVRYFEPYFDLPPGQGLIHQAVFDNYTSGLVTTGLTTEDEMFITMIQYTRGNPIPYVSLNAEKEYVCINSDPIDLRMVPETGGTLTGTGVVGNQFHPDMAGPGFHTVSYTFDGITSNYDFVVTELPSETPEIVQNDNVLSLTEEFDGYQWYLDGVLIDGAIGNALTVNQAGTYSVAAQRSDCTLFSNDIEVILEGISQAATNPDLSVFPNPLTNQTKVRFELPYASNVNLEVYDLAGARVAHIANTQQLAAGKHQFNIGDNNWAKGVYLLKLSVEGNTFHRKLLKN